LLQEQKELEKQEKEKEDAKTNNKSKKTLPNKSSKQVIATPNTIDETIRLFNKDEEENKKVSYDRK